jgi:hypothetical protein
MLTSIPSVSYVARGLLHVGLALICGDSLISSAAPASLVSASGAIRFEISGSGSSVRQVISIKTRAGWEGALSANESAVRLISSDPKAPELCSISSYTDIQSPQGLLLRGDCSVFGSFERRLTVASDPDVIDVSLRFAVKPGAKILSLEDRYNFSPARRQSETPLSGPLDFVWSQNIKSEPDDIIPNWSFKSPVVMMQQGEIFAALMPTLNQRQSVPVALDLDVTSGATPWLSYGALQSEPHGHSYFRRSRQAGPHILAGFIEYSYSIMASAQPEKLGYRRVVRRLWALNGHPSLIASTDLQRNTVRPELALFDDWRRDAWMRYADEIYHEFPCSARQCGTLASNRNIAGDWDKPQPDAWFNSWFETLRSAYGWYVYGRNKGDREIQRKAETVLNLALSSPQRGGAFSTVYLLQDKRWVRDDGWAGFQDSYHAFCMSWTAYWMLRWADDLVPNRRQEILAFVTSYGDFLLEKQLPSGVIPSWYGANLVARPEFGDFNAETAGCALLLAELARQTGRDKYRRAAERAMDFIARDVIPRQRWFDFETFKSCARKNFDFYDRWTAQYPQNNLSTIQAAKAYLALYRLTKDAKYLERGTQVLDYLLLTQQVWNNPSFSPKLIGGFTTQNTDAEWSDARQCYAAVLLWDYYQATGSQEYLERAVAAARSTFAVAPWENWAHTGYRDEPGSMTGFHWSTGSAMTSVEIMYPLLGDVFIDLEHHAGVGFNATSLRDLSIRGTLISFHLDRLQRHEKASIHFSGVDEGSDYTIEWNGYAPQKVRGAALTKQGFEIEQ